MMYIYILILAKLHQIRIFHCEQIIHMLHNYQKDHIFQSKEKDFHLQIPLDAYKSLFLHYWQTSKNYADAKSSFTALLEQESIIISGTTAMRGTNFEKNF